MVWNHDLQVDIASPTGDTVIGAEMWRTPVQKVSSRLLEGKSQPPRRMRRGITWRRDKENMQLVV